MKLRMLQLLKRFCGWVCWRLAGKRPLVIPCWGRAGHILRLRLPTTFSDKWQTVDIGFDPIPAYNGAPPYIGVNNPGNRAKETFGCKGISPQYAGDLLQLDQTFCGFFGVYGEQAVDAPWPS